ncbi:hypothetical protein RBEAN4_1540 [Rickettsia bellii str. RML An4]|uniref:Uncharacterized protein n=1 Tax=Rickettsia bellii str. RML An4 TaxID=1359193 RepID=A0A0F3QGF8_RICBE|nr:hypothetical protein RBEAN4_1540 [Rickettsia bellii str. RML An4]
MYFFLDPVDKPRDDNYDVFNTSKENKLNQTILFLRGNYVIFIRPPNGVF